MPKKASSASSQAATRADRPSRVYLRLRELIVRGQMPPGSRLVEQDLAQRLGVSRTPVRAALALLEREGYLLVPPGSRRAQPVVAPLTESDAVEVFELVGAVEGLAARGAAGLAAPLRRSLAAALRKVNRELEQESAALPPVHDRLHALDLEFHRLYVEAGGGERLRALHHTLKPQTERYDWLYIALLSGSIGVSVAEHERIARAIAKGDPEEAELAVETNWRNAAQRLATVIRQVGERGTW